MTSAAVIGVVLAGGKSARMGTAKAALAVGGGTLLDWMQARLRSAGLTEAVISGGQHGGLADLLPGRGPLGALHALAHQYPGRCLLAVPVDMPLLRAHSLRHLIANYRDPGSPLHYQGFPFPLLLTMTPAIRALLDATLSVADGDFSVAAFLRRAPARELALVAGADEFANLNTPAEWAAFVAQAVAPQLPGD